MNDSGSANKKLILAAMIFAVSMTFIDMTIVAIAVPSLQDDLSLSATGVQWIINGYLLSLSALFAFGGRLADIAGHRRMVVLGVIVFATASGLCGATPTGNLDEVWLITFRIIQGAGAAIMFPAALAIVLGAFPVRERGRAMAIFFAITGGLTSIGPLAGGYLVEISWRTIFWVNIPVAIIALILTAIAKPDDHKHPAPLDYRGTVLISGGMGLAILGLQQSSVWGWGSVLTWGCIAAGLALIAAFVAFELRVANPLIRVRIFENRAFAVDNAILFLLMIPFVPLFFFASMYAQISLGESASETGLYLLIFFAGFATASQWGGRILDRVGARPSVVLGCAVAAVGFALWAHSLPDLSVSSQWYWIVLAGAGVGLVLGPANTDALNRLPASHYGEATGITQTVRNFGSSLGLAVLGTILILENKANLESTLGAQGVPKAKADQIADSISQGSSSSSAGFAEAAGKHAQQLFAAVQHDFALASRTVFYAMAGVMALAFVIALAAMPAGKVEEAVEEEPGASPAGAALSP
ncbi:MAG TPA: MFS transporter [Solirubrobacterales bacterium]|jgi:EmrB/QacA subfamily drug resistance transporter|nr:MFS transporter [Solirubrobacterales bacterium]